VSSRVVAAAVLIAATGFGRAGSIALWANIETDAYFGPVIVTSR